MTKNEFIEASCKTGYCTKAQAKSYCGRNPKDTYTDDDFIDIYRFAQRYDYVGGVCNRSLGDGCYTSKKLHGDGGEEGNR